MKRLELLITNGELAGRRFGVKDGGLRLGRSSSNDIHIPDEQLSRNHCLFEPVGDTGVRVTDLASANGTLLNGKALGNDPAELKAGDTVEVGATVIGIVGDEPPNATAGSVDLGLGGTGETPRPTAGKRRSPLANVLWCVAIAVAAFAIYVYMKEPPVVEQPVRLTEEKPVVKELYYEKVEANLDGIFRYELTVTPDGLMRVALDDTRENRHPTIAPRQLDARAREELNEIVSFAALSEIDREYEGPEPDPPAMNSWTLRVVYTTRTRSISIVNTQEPEKFRSVREKLETFSKNELGINAIQYPRAKLIEFAESSLAVAKAKWDDREVQHGNLYGAVTAFREALFYLETVDPKPDCAQEARKGLEQATALLDERIREQRFLANRAINLGQWETAQKELTVLIEMIPDRKDDRNREASAKLIDVEKRMKGGN